MSLLGSDALGRLTLGQITARSDKQVNFSGVAGIGVAGSLSGGVASLLIGAVGVGTAGSLSVAESSGIAAATGIGIAGSITGSVQAFFLGTAGIGAAGSLSGLEGAGLVGAPGIGVAGSFGPSLINFLVGVAGTGVAGSLSGPNVVPLAPFFGGYDGLTSARYALGQITGPRTDGGIAISVVVPAALGTGTAGSLTSLLTTGLVGAWGAGVAGTITGNPAGSLLGVSGQGIAGIITIVISGGGGNGAAASGDGERRKKRKTGLEPVKKLPPRPIRKIEARIPLPPPAFIRPAPSIVPGAPFELVDQALIPPDLLGLQAQIHAAEDISDIQRFLRGIEQDEQDAADIADILALLD